MTMTKQTPGPWTIERVTEHLHAYAPYLRIVGADGVVVSVHAINNIEAYALDPSPYDAADANARLIAAAPDLLAACEDAAREIADLMSRIDDSHAEIATGNASVAMGRALAAITRATVQP